MIIIMTLAVVMTIGGSNCDGIYEGWLALARLLIFRLLVQLYSMERSTVGQFRFGDIFIPILAGSIGGGSAISSKC